MNMLITYLNCSKNLLKNVNDILINDMLDFSKIDAEGQELHNRNFDLRNCIEEVLDMFAGRAADAGSDLIYQIDAGCSFTNNGRLQKASTDLNKLS